MLLQSPPLASANFNSIIAEFPFTPLGLLTTADKRTKLCKNIAYSLYLLTEILEFVV